MGLNNQLDAYIHHAANRQQNSRANIIPQILLRDPYRHALGHPQRLSRGGSHRRLARFLATFTLDSRLSSFRCRTRCRIRRSRVDLISRQLLRQGLDIGLLRIDLLYILCVSRYRLFRLGKGGFA